MELKETKNIGPYHFVSKDEVRTFENGRKFRFLLYGAYSAYGLIGTECNGVAVLDEDDKRVVCDEIGCAQSGYFGPSEHQEKMFKLLASEWSWDAFRHYINVHPRSRFHL